MNDSNIPYLHQLSSRKPWDQLSNDHQRKKRKLSREYLLNPSEFKPCNLTTKQILLKPPISNASIISNSDLHSVKDDDRFRINDDTLSEAPIHTAFIVENEPYIEAANFTEAPVPIMYTAKNEINFTTTSDSNDTVTKINHKENNTFNEIVINKNKIDESNQFNTKSQLVGQQMDHKEFTFEIFKHNLGKCIVDNHINLTQSKAMLDVLHTNPALRFLPKDPRSLIHTPREKIKLKVVPPGEYLHLGIKERINILLSRISPDSIPNYLLIDFSTDGAELNENYQMWPIQVRVVNILCHKSPELVGIYRGQSKPESFQLFFEDFINEVEDIDKKGGILFNNNRLPIKFRCFIADAPARAHVLGTISHNGSFPCSKCVIKGVYHNRANRYPGLNYKERTDSDFRKGNDGDHNVMESAIKKLDIDLVKQVPFDYMHLVCLGVMKKSIAALAFGKCKLKPLQDFELKVLSNRLLTLQNYCPREFARIPREIEKYAKYKATEFRQLLLYTFIVAAPAVITVEQYNHFLLLHAAMRVLLNDSSSEEDVNFAEKALSEYVLKAEDILGLEFITYNTHGLLHLATDYRNFGSSESTSAFVYENNMRKYSGYVRKPNQPLQQIKKRTCEESMFQSTENVKTSGELKASEEHETGPVLDLMRIRGCTQYENFESPDFYHSIQNNENTIITHENKIGIIKNIIYCKNQYFHAVQFFERLQPFYNVLSKTSVDFGVFLCSELNTEISYILWTEVKSKCFRMPVWVKKLLTPFVNDEQLNNAYVSVVM